MHEDVLLAGAGVFEPGAEIEFGDPVGEVRLAALGDLQLPGAPFGRHGVEEVLGHLLAFFGEDDGVHDHPSAGRLPGGNQAHGHEGRIPGEQAAVGLPVHEAAPSGGLGDLDAEAVLPVGGVADHQHVADDLAFLQQHLPLAQGCRQGAGHLGGGRSAEGRPGQGRQREAVFARMGQVAARSVDVGRAGAGGRDGEQGSDDVEQVAVVGEGAEGAARGARVAGIAHPDLERVNGGLAGHAQAIGRELFPFRGRGAGRGVVVHLHGQEPGAGRVRHGPVFHVDLQRGHARQHDARLVVAELVEAEQGADGRIRDQLDVAAVELGAKRRHRSRQQAQEGADADRGGGHGVSGRGTAFGPG